MSYLLKLIYTALLLGASGLLMRELWTVWFDTKVYIGRFDVVTAGGLDETASNGFSRQIVGAQAILGQQLSDYQTRRSADAPSDSTFVLTGMGPLMLPPEALGGIDITVQNLNIRQILTAARRTLLAPNEVRGSIAIGPGSVTGTALWARAPDLPNGRGALRQFLIPGKASPQEAAAYVACSISWSRAVSIEPKIRFSREQFCDFAAALGDLYALNDAASAPGGLKAEQAALVRKRAGQLRSHYGSDALFPELYRLRADLLDLLPEALRTTEDLVDAQEDRLRYAMLSPALGELPESERRLAALAMARPAIPIEAGELADPPENWAGLLRRHAPQVRAAAAATGILRLSEGTPFGTGFLVAPGLLMTSHVGLDYARSSTRTTDAEGELVFCLDERVEGECATSFRVGEVVYEGVAGNSPIALVEISGHDPVLHPPLPLYNPLPAADAVVGRYAFILGYPFFDARMPTAFSKRLLGDADGRKRLMPGRVLALGASPISYRAAPGSEQPPVFTNDISTSGGTAGGPLIDLLTGRVLGVSYSGIWKGERGKFAYSASIPDAALRLVADYTAGRGRDRKPEE